MTKEQVIELAKKAGFHFWDAEDKGILHTTGDKFSQKCFERFATLVGNAKLEEAAKAIRSLNDLHHAGLVDATIDAIRNLKEPTP